MNNNEIEVFVNNEGNKYYVIKNNDLDLTNPNIINLNFYLNKLNDKTYFKNKLLHREDGPAIEKFNGIKEWYKSGKLHREDGPAIEYNNGDKEWYKNGKRHREDGPAFESMSGIKVWYKNGIIHREDGPAIVSNDGTIEYWVNGVLHREDGPAVIIRKKKLLFFKETIKEYHLNGYKVSEEAFYLEKELRNSIINNNKVRIKKSKI